MRLRDLIFVPEGVPPFMDTFIANVAKDTASPITIIQAIIAAIMQIMSTCPIPVAASDVTTPSNKRTIAIFRGMLASGVRPLSAEGRALLTSIESNANSLQPADVKTLLTMANAPTAAS